MKIASISIADYCEATTGMPHDAERLYFRMILKMLSREGGLPDDDAENARIFGYDRRVFSRLKAKLIAWPDAIYVEDGLLKNARVENDIADFKTRRSEAVENGRKGGLAKAEVSKKSGESPAEVSQKSTRIPHTTNNEINEIAVASPSPSPSPEEEKPPNPRKRGKPAISKIEVLEAFEAYNATALRCGLPQASKLTPDRERKIGARLNDFGLEGWHHALANIERSSFLTGEKGFRADLDFMTQAKSFGKLHDGGYGNGRHVALPVDPMEIDAKAQAMQRRVEEMRRATAEALAMTEAFHA